MSDDDEHGGILDGKALEEAIAGLEQAERGDDPDAAYAALAKVGAIVREMLENTADLHGLRHDRMCLAAMVAVFDMAQDAKPDLQSAAAGYARGRLEQLASHH
jgi:hypothetical protein